MHEIYTAKKLGRQEKKEVFISDPYHRRAYRFLKANLSEPLCALKRKVLGPFGQAPGTLTSDPSELDSIIKHDYLPVFEGNISDEKEHADTFTTKYLPYLFTGPAVVLPPIIDSELMNTCQAGPFTASGLDGWAPRDTTLFPLACFTFWAYMLNAIEAGKAWPQGVLHAQTAFLAKDPTKQSHDPMDYRLLLLLPTLTRTWAKHRLSQLTPLIETWKVDDLFAGIPGLGAEDAWWLSSCTSEVYRRNALPLTGA